MRLMTRQIYRAFPELDSFSDEQCRFYVARVTSSWRYLAVMPVCVLAGIGGIAVLSITVLRTLALILDDLRLGAAIREMANPLIMIGAVLMVVVLPGIAGLRVRDHVLWLFLRSQIGRARCLGCEYSLLGQRIIAGTITCPECGRATTLHELGMQSADELIPPGAAQRTAHFLSGSAAGCVAGAPSGSVVADSGSSAESGCVSGAPDGDSGCDSAVSDFGFGSGGRLPV